MQENKILCHPVYKSQLISSRNNEGGEPVYNTSTIVNINPRWKMKTIRMALQVPKSRFNPPPVSVTILDAP